MSVTDSKDGLTLSSNNSKSLNSEVHDDENANGQHSIHKYNKSSRSQGDKKTPTKRCKLVIVGDGCCGKTSLLTVFKSGKFPEDHIPTIFETDIAKLRFSDEDFIRKEKVEEIEFSLWDTAGQESYDRLRPLSYPSSDVVLICFAIDSPDSLANVEVQWAKEVKHFCKGVPVILVGNKIDLRGDQSMVASLAKKNQVPVSTEKTKAMATKINAYAYVECSAKIQQGVQDVFETAAKAALNKNRSIMRIDLPRRCPIL